MTLLRLTPKNLPPLNLLNMWRMIVLSCLIACPVGARGADLFPSPLTQAEPGATALIPIYVSGAVRLTAGTFTLRLTPDVPNSSPLSMSVTEGSALAAASQCDACRSLSAYPLLTQPGTDGAVSALFVLPSGQPTPPTEGINGQSQEIVRVQVSVSATAPVGTSYTLSISDARFSNADSHAVEVVTQAGKLEVIAPLTLEEGENTAYHDPARPGHLLIPTSGDDPATPTMEAGFPNDGRVVGNRKYAFKVNRRGAAGTKLAWSVSARNLDGTFAPAELTGSVEAGDAEGTTGIYTPADAAMRMAKALQISLTAQVEGSPGRSLTIHAFLFPYGDANLDGAVTKEDYDLAFRWANGLLLPADPLLPDSPDLAGYAPSPVRRLLTDVRTVPGERLNDETFNQWTGELRHLGLPEPSTEAHDHQNHPFGDGRITHADALWILRKAELNAADPALTLDPRLHGVNPVSF